MEKKHIFTGTATALVTPMKEPQRAQHDEQL